MGVVTEKYVKKPLFVDAVRVTEQNFDELVDWVQTTTQAEVIDDGSKKFIKIFVHSPKNAKQTKAFIGDWLLKTDLGIKIYTNRAFRGSFEPVEVEEFVPATPENIAQAVQETEVAREQEEAAQTHEYGPGETKENTCDTEEIPIAPPPTPAITPPAQSTEPSEPTETEPDIPEEAGGRARMDVGGKRILTEQEQREMGSEEVRELLRAGEVVLEQDLAA